MTKQKWIRGVICVLWLSLMLLCSIAQTMPTPEAVSWKNVANFSSGVLAVADTGTSLLVGAGSKIHRSTDGGNTWTESNTGNTISAPTGFAVLGTKVFVAGSNLIEVSTNDGQSWTKAADLIGANQLAVYNNILYATTFAGRGIYRSTDGTTWTQLGQSTGLGSLTSFVGIDGAFIVVSDLSGVYRSIDNGATWTKALSGACNGANASGNTLYASLLDGVYRSRDKGATWVRTNLYSFTTGSAPAVNGKQIFVVQSGTTYDVMYSPDEGYNWFSITSPASFINSIFFKPGTVLVGTLLGGLWSGTQLNTLPPAPAADAYWENIANLRTFDNSISTAQIKTIGNTLFAIGGGKVLRSTNFGFAWQNVTPANAQSTIIEGQQMSAGSKYLFLATSIGVYRSSDNGTTWQAATPLASSAYWVYAKGETVFSYMSSRFFRSTDNGTSWTQLTAGTRHPDGIVAVGNNLLEFDRNGVIYKSTDNGVTRTQVTTSGLPTFIQNNAYTYSHMAESGGTIFIKVERDSPGIYKSINEGQTWTKVTTNVGGVANPTRFDDMLYDGKNLLLTSAGGANGLGSPTYDVFLSTDAGQSYFNLKANSINFTNNDSKVIATLGSKIYMVNRMEELWVRTGSIITPQTTVSAASYAGDAATAEGIASAFGNGMTIYTESATTVPLPTTLGEVQVKVKDSAGIERLAGLFYVSPMQVNYQIPAGTAPGTAMVTVMSASGVTVANGNVTVSAVAPGLFTSNMDGTGVPAALVQRFSAGGAMAYEPIGVKDGTGKYVPTPIDLGPATDRVYIGLFGTGVRGRSDLSKVAVTIGGQAATVEYAGSQNQFVGLDQINVLIPRSLIGKAETDLVLTVDGKAANTVRVNIK